MVTRCLFLFVVLLLLASVDMTAQKVKVVCGTYEYHAPTNVSPEQAEQTAIERAKLQAIADEFGTIVSQSNSTIVLNKDEQSSVEFLSIGGSDVKGEWIETIGEPEITKSWEQDMLVVKVIIKGKVREIKDAGIDVIASTLRNSPNLRYASTDFNSGDDLYLYFKAPLDGFLSVYLHDVIEGNVYCLLPYKSSVNDVVKIEHDRDYIFFSSNNSSEESVDEYVMTSSQPKETNVMYLVFSTRNPYKANTLEGVDMSMPRLISYSDFQRWLSQVLSKDETTICKKIFITINL